MPDTPPEDNQRVTNVRLGMKIDHLTETVAGWHDDSCKRLEAVERRAAANSEAIILIVERQSAASKAQAVYTTVAAAIAGAVGTWFK